MKAILRSLGQIFRLLPNRVMLIILTVILLGSTVGIAHYELTHKTKDLTLTTKPTGTSSLCVMGEKGCDSPKPTNPQEAVQNANPNATSQKSTQNNSNLTYSAQPNYNLSTQAPANASTPPVENPTTDYLGNAPQAPIPNPNCTSIDASNVATYAASYKSDVNDYTVDWDSINNLIDYGQLTESQALQQINQYGAQINSTITEHYNYYTSSDELYGCTPSLTIQSQIPVCVNNDLECINDIPPYN